MAATGLSLPSAPVIPGRPLRLGVLFFFIILLAAGIAARLAYWQVAQSAVLQKRLAAQKTLDEQVPARRGRILDTNRDLLAGNLSVDYLYADTGLIKNPLDVATKLAPVLGTSPDTLLPLLTDAERRYARLLGGRKLTPEESAAVSELRLPGIFLEPTTK